MKRVIVLIAVATLMGAAIFLWLRLARPPLNVVLVSIDTLRPDHLGCYGYGRPTSPAIDRLAREGVRFETVVSSTTWTLAAHVSMLTSLPDPVHGVIDEERVMDEGLVTLAEIMSAHGYDTAGVFTGPYLLPRFGFSQGFDSYINATKYVKKQTGPGREVAYELTRTTQESMDKVERWMDGREERPFFLFLHLFDVHPDFDPPPPYDTMFDPDYRGEMNGKYVAENPAINPDMDRADLDHLVALYDGEIRYVDADGIDRLLMLLDSRKLLDRTLIVITADHGEEFFEHGMFGHRLNLYDTTLRIPLIFWRPGLIPEGGVIRGQVRIIDIMPTILELAGLPPNPEALGRSLAGMISGKEEAGGRPAFAELTDKEISMEALRTEDYKIIYDHRANRISYFNYHQVPDESELMPNPPAREVRRAELEFREEKTFLGSVRAASPQQGSQPTALDPETRQRLESLGYIR